MKLDMLEIMDRAMNTGTKEEIKDFDMRVYRETTRLIKKYDINLNKNNAVNLNNEIADKLFLAGKEFYLNLGTYNMDTKRVIKFSEDELNSALNSLPGTIEVGFGNELRKVSHRKLDSNDPLFVQGGVIGGNATEDMLLPLYRSIAKEKLVDSLYFDPPHVIENKSVMFGGPIEMKSAIETVKKVKEAVRLENRPGLHLLGGAGSAVADISTFCEFGLKQTDGICAHTTSELKTDLDSLNKIMYTVENGHNRQVWWAPVIGGYAGGVEGTAIAAIGGFFHGIMVGQAYKNNTYLDLQVTPYYNSGATDMMSLQILSAAGQAISRNSKAAIMGTLTTSSGPGTKEMIYEIAASTIAQTVSGYNLFGVRIHKPTKKNHGTGMESRIMAEVGQASINLDIERANNIIKVLMKKYDKVHNEGFGFEELYNLDLIEPKQFYIDIYDEVKCELELLGIRFN